jgi:hypothetical protein
MGTITMLLLVANSVVFRDVWAGVIKEPVVVAPKFRSLSSNIFSQTSQNITVKVRVDRSVRKNKFTVNNPLRIGKKMNMPLVDLRICRAFFALGDCGLFHCDYCCFVSGI